MPKAGGIKHHSQKGQDSARVELWLFWGLSWPPVSLEEALGSFTPTPEEWSPNEGPSPSKCTSSGEGTQPLCPTHAPAPAAGRAYTDLSRGDPPTSGPLFDGGRSRVRIRDVRPQCRFRGGRQDLVQLLCTAKEVPPQPRGP